MTGRIFLAAVVVCACSTGATPSDAGPDASDPFVDDFDFPLSNDPELVKQFNIGDDLFSTVFRDGDGLGPYYIRQSCTSCHEEAVRGPGFAKKMAVVQADGFTPSPDQSLLKWGNTERPFMTAGAMTPLVAPTDPSVKVSIRLGMPLLGHGYMEAVDPAEIMRLESEQAARTDAIHGKINWVTYESEPNPDTRFWNFKKGDKVIGRFGVKARQPSIDDFAADALNRDIGITSALRPSETPNPDNLTDDMKPGVDVTADHVNGVAMYIRLQAIPTRVVTEQGKMLFAQVGCAVCHQPTMKTRADYPIKPLAGIDAPIYTDMLLHHWNDKFGDGVVDGQAASTQWRTAPLIGLRFNKVFLHDGSATSIEGAIVAHSGEATDTQKRFMALSAEDKKTLLDFVGAL